MDSVDEITPAVPQFRRPADYYASPADSAKTIFPKWVPFGCGTASIVFVIGMVFMGSAVSSGAFTELFEFVIASMEGEITKMMATDVKPQPKAVFQAEMKTMRASIRTGRLSMERLQPLMKTIRDVSGDETVTGAEVDRLTREVKAINAATK